MLIKPFYNVEFSPSDGIHCLKCGCELKATNLVLVKTEKKVFSSQWCRKTYCPECGIENISSRRSCMVRKALGLGVDMADLDRRVKEVNRQNGYDFNFKRRCKEDGIPDTF